MEQSWLDADEIIDEDDDEPSASGENIGEQHAVAGAA